MLMSPYVMIAAGFFAAMLTFMADNVAVSPQFDSSCQLVAVNDSGLNTYSCN
jgi:hypothetical protein